MTESRKDGLVSRSGDTRRTSTRPAARSSRTSSHSVMFAELSVRATTPARAAAATWSRMSASNGEMMREGPRPACRMSLAAMK